MFNRLIENLGTILTKTDAAEANNAETQLAVALLLFAVLKADRAVKPEELVSLRTGLTHIFNLGDDRLNKLISRAFSVYTRDPSLFAPATILKHRVSLSFRQLVVATARDVAISDGELHDYELDVIERITSLLGLNRSRSQRLTA